MAFGYGTGCIAWNLHPVRLDANNQRKAPCFIQITPLLQGVPNLFSTKVHVLLKKLKVLKTPSS